MKKIISSLLMAVLLVACVFSAGCTKIPKDFKDARRNLLDQEYDVVVIADLQEFIYEFYGMWEVFEDSDVEVIEDGYGWLLDDLMDDYKHDFEKGILAIGVQDGVGEFIFIAYFEDKEETREFYKDIEGLFEELCECRMEGEFNDDIKYGKSGKAVYFGTEGALKDVK